MSRPTLGDSKSVRFQMVITEDELSALDEWMFSNRVRSRSGAVRHLIQFGIENYRVETSIARAKERAKAILKLVEG